MSDNENTPCAPGTPEETEGGVEAPAEKLEELDRAEGLFGEATLEDEELRAAAGGNILEDLNKAIAEYMDKGHTFHFTNAPIVSTGQQNTPVYR